ncbi:GNAT family N-acetyltransferase [Herbiconiux sp. P15]|uniref:GNAT family N-acetyltransferase n=1 Tax=Herbiconiux liukaitaii TaxID=3342799 RepID=UPI0035B6B29A
MSSAPEYDLRTFPAALAEGSADAATREWLQAESRGFHEPRLTAELVDRAAAEIAADGRRLTGAYPRGAADELPVATFAAYEKTLNVGGAEPLPAHLIAGVTVRPTHRRRGLLRRMMTADLQAARDAGLAIAALTVSEATIYRRFGFGAAYWVHEVSVTTGPRFQLTVRPAGRCELIEAAELVHLAPVVFAAFHARTPGSVDRQQQYVNRSAGLSGPTGGDATVRAAVHLDEAGAVDGYVSYRVHEGKTSTELEVIDLVAAGYDAYLGLWELLGSMDLVDSVRFHSAPADDPLRWALADWRALRTTAQSDQLWIRILDVARAFEARGYRQEASGEIVLEVSDELGHAAGRYRLQVSDGGATVTPAGDAPADLELEAWALGSLYLGAVQPTVLAAAGQLRERSDGAASRLGALLAPVRPVYGITHF